MCSDILSFFVQILGFYILFRESHKFLQTVNTRLRLVELSLVLLNVLCILFLDLRRDLRFVVGDLGLCDCLVEQVLGLHGSSAEKVNRAFDLDDSDNLQENLNVVVDVALKAAGRVGVGTLKDLGFATLAEGLEDVAQLAE